MGSTFQARLRSKVDQILETTYYDGTKRHFSFEKYAETLQRAFVDFQSTQEVSEERKFCVLLNGISNPRLEATKNKVVASDHLQSTFEVATNFLNWALDSKISYSAVNCKLLTAAKKQQVRDQRAERNKCQNIEVLGTVDTKRPKLHRSSTNENEAIGILDPKVNRVGAVMSQWMTNSNSNNNEDL